MKQIVKDRNRWHSVANPSRKRRVTTYVCTISRSKLSVGTNTGALPVFLVNKVYSLRLAIKITGIFTLDCTHDYIKKNCCNITRTGFSGNIISPSIVIIYYVILY